MFLILGKIFGAIVDGVMAVFKFLLAHPWIIAVIVAALVAGYFGIQYGERKIEAKYAPIIAKYKAEVEARIAKIAQVEEDSRKAAEDGKKEVEAIKLKLTTVSDSYEKRIAQMEKNPKIKVVEVMVPGIERTTTIYVENGEVSCRRLPSEFVLTINEMVDVVNGEAEK